MNGNAKAWVRALRSGNYIQGKGVLKTDDGKFCCLGIACEVYLKAGGTLATGGIIEDATVAGPRYSGKLYTLPPEVKEFMGLKTEGGQFRYGDNLANALTDMNDAGESFFDIATLIESEPEGLFVKPEFTAVKAAHVRRALGSGVAVHALNTDPNFHGYYEPMSHTYSPLGFLFALTGVWPTVLGNIESRFIGHADMSMFAQALMDEYGFTDLDQLEFIQMEWDKARNTDDLLRYPAILVSGLVW